MPDALPERPTWLLVIAAGVVVIAGAFVVDALVELEGSTRTIVRVAVLVAAVLVAGTGYQRWGSVRTRTAPHHAMAGAALLGGALVASSVFTNTSGVFGNSVTGALGAVALFIALFAARATLSPAKDVR